MTNPKIAILKTSNSDPATLDWVRRESLWDLVSDPKSYDFLIQVIENRVQLLMGGEDAPGPLELDFQSEEWKFRTKTLSKNQLLFKAIGFKNGQPKVLDATAGLGRDAYSCVLMGASIKAIEENLAVYLLLKNAVDRLGDSVRERFEVIHANSLQLISNLEEEQAPDVIYLDPMYEHVEKKSKPKKELFMLRELISKPPGVEELLEASLQMARRHVVLKQPSKSPGLSVAPQHSFEGKMVRYDRFTR